MWPRPLLCMHWGKLSTLASHTVCTHLCANRMFFGIPVSLPVTADIVVPALFKSAQFRSETREQSDRSVDPCVCLQCIYWNHIVGTDSIVAYFVETAWSIWKNITVGVYIAQATTLEGTSTLIACIVWYIIMSRGSICYLKVLLKAGKDQR